MNGPTFSDLLVQAFGPDAVPAPVRPARPPAHCDGRTWREYRLALDRYERDVRDYRKGLYL